MNERYFLYLDIPGFTDLVRQGSNKIDDLYEVIASLNAHSHDAFKVIVFSDTVVVYNVDGGHTPADSQYLIMFLCEFVKDLMHRLTGRGVYFRAVITHGDFTHYEINGVNRPGFPGECFICELRLPDHRFRWKHNKLFLLLPEEYGPAFPAIVDCYTSPPTLVWPVPLLHGFSSSYGVLPPLCKDH